MGEPNEELNSPDSSQQEETNSDAILQDPGSETGAEPSTAPAGEKKDLLSVVRDAVQPKAGEPASPSGQGTGGQPEGEAAEGTQEPKAPDNESYSDVPFNNHPRFKQLIAERNRYREPARQYGQMQEFLQANAMTAEEAADAWIIAAMMKTDPAGAWDRLKPMVQDLLQRAGHVLPEDLRQRVAQGQMTKEAAIEVSRARASVATTQQQVQFREQQQARQVQNQTVAAVKTAVSEWETTTRARDADFDAKQEALLKEVHWLQRNEGVPRTPAEAVAQVKKAYDAVNKTVTKPAPRPSQQRQTTQGRTTSGQPTTAPKTMLELVQQSVGSQG